MTSEFPMTQWRNGLAGIRSGRALSRIGGWMTALFRPKGEGWGERRRAHHVKWAFGKSVIHWSLVLGHWSFRPLLALCALTGGAAGPALTTAPTKASLVWPPAPDAPRIAYVRSLEGPADLGVKRSTLGKFTGWLTGTRRESEQFVKPFAIALDEKGNLCFTDTGANAVCFYDQQHKLWHRWEQVGGVRFASPVGVAKEGSSLYVADSALSSVIAFNEGGQLLSEIKVGLQRPTGVAIAGHRLFVVDSQLQAICRFDLEGRPAGQFGRRGAGAGEFNFPTHISVDLSGNLLVTDSMNSRIQVFDPEGRFLRQVGSVGDSPGHFSRPKGAAVDSFGHLYVVDANFDNVQLFDGQGQLLMDLGEAGSGPGEFWLPNGIAIGRDNLIYVADTYNRRIQVFKFIGQP
jgi:sugar lactone lactonase YvrE